MGASHSRLNLESKPISSVGTSCRTPPGSGCASRHRGAGRGPPRNSRTATSSAAAGLRDGLTDVLDRVVHGHPLRGGSREIGVRLAARELFAPLAGVVAIIGILAGRPPVAVPNAGFKRLRLPRALLRRRSSAAAPRRSVASAASSVCPCICPRVSSSSRTRRRAPRCRSRCQWHRPRWRTDGDVTADHRARAERTGLLDGAAGSAPLIASGLGGVAGSAPLIASGHASTGSTFDLVVICAPRAAVRIA